MQGVTLDGDPFRPPKKKKVREERSSEQAPPPAATGPFRIFLRPEAQKSYDDLPSNIQEAMGEIFGRLTAWPQVSGAIPLFGKGFAPNKFRMKTWDWRVEFLVNPAVREITIVRIGHRDSFYDVYH